MMTTISSRVLRVFLLSALVCAATACSGKESPVSPLTPSLSQPTLSQPTVGATIGGTVTGFASGPGTLALRVLTFFSPTLHASSFSDAVSVVGTSITAPISSNGTFTLSGVPPGDVQLEFNIGGVVATLTVPAVQQLERITLVVTVNGSAATISGNIRDAGNSSTELEGPVGVITAASRTFQVLGITVTVPADATIAHGSTMILFADLRVGDIVHVKGTRTATGMTAREVYVQNPAGTPLGDTVLEGAVSAVSGGCPTPTLTVNTKTITTTADTQFLAGACSDLIVGITVHVTGAMQANGSVRASQVRIERGQTVQVDGSVTAVSGCPTPTLTVGGKTIKSNADTKFIGATCSEITVGTTVQVTGTSLADGSVVASQIRIERGQTVQVEGSVTAFSGCPTPTLTVGGKTIKSNADTRFISGTCSNITVGSTVQVTGVSQSDGSVLASQIRIEKK
jgi:hypothetical protein